MYKFICEDNKGVIKVLKSDINVESVLMEFKIRRKVLV